MSEEIKQDINLTDLNQFYGTERYHRVMNFNVTDGVAYCMRNGYSWFVTDFLALILARHKRLINEEFLAIDLIIVHDHAVMKVTDGNENILYEQKYKWTNCTQDLKLYFTNGVLMLSGEY